MQNPVINSFRARLAKLGYTDISIKQYKFIDQQMNYLVKAKEPLSGFCVYRFMSITEMFYFRIH